MKLLRYSLLLVSVLTLVFPAAVHAAETAPSINTGRLLAPAAFRAALDKARPVIVRIETFAGVQASVRGVGSVGEGPTTGVIISPDGHIITSTFNFIKKPKIITVVLADGTRKVATLLGRDDARKLCLLKIDDVKDLPVAETISRDSLRVGQWALSVGVGFSRGQPTMSAGILSAKRRISGRAVQTDANISPANYGGPLLDLHGHVIGICVPLNPQAKDVSSGADWYDSGIGFAVPLDELGKQIEIMKRGDSIEPGRMGVQLKKEGKANERGRIKIEKVVDDSAAAKAGLKKGDIIAAIDGAEPADLTQMMAFARGYDAGDLAKLKILRGDKTLDIDIVFGSAEKKESADDKKKKLLDKLPLPFRKP